MTAELADSQPLVPVIQFSVFADNKVGRLNECVQCLGREDIHILAITSLDTTESTIMRIIVDYPEQAREVLQDHGYSFTETEILAVELKTATDIRTITAGLTEAEINIHYVYPFVCRPNGHSALAFSLEDNDLAAQVLQTRQIRVLTQLDIAR